ncbi:hypothetical protein DCO49_00470 [Stenotrophomonas sp. SPM]|nr:hypothetical protein DCO49_00470 [Stenotrophomonas sp. SPM]
MNQSKCGQSRSPARESGWQSVGRPCRAVRGGLAPAGRIAHRISSHASSATLCCRGDSPGGTQQAPYRHRNLQGHHRQECGSWAAMWAPSLQSRPAVLSGAWRGR